MWKGPQRYALKASSDASGAVSSALLAMEVSFVAHTDGIIDKDVEKMSRYLKAHKKRHGWYRQAYSQQNNLRGSFLREIL